MHLDAWLSCILERVSGAARMIDSISVTMRSICVAFRVPCFGMPARPMPTEWKFLTMSGLRGRRLVTVSAVITLLTSLLVVPGQAHAAASIVEPVDRERVVSLWQAGGPMVRPAAEAALLGT